MSTTTPSKGILGSVRDVLNHVLGAFGQPLTQKFVAHVLTVGATAAAVALLPLGLSTELNAVIVVVSGIAAHWIAPPEAAKPPAA